MKLCQGILLAVLLAVVPVLSACGTSEAERAQQRAYEEVLEIYQEQMDAYQEQQKAYYEGRAKALKQYEEAYKLWYEKQQQQLLEQFKQQQTDNQTTESQ